MNLLFVTGNASKVALANERLRQYGIAVRQLKAKFVESRSLSVEEIAIEKAKQVMDSTTSPFIIEDSSFCIDALHGFPGTYVKMAFDTLGEARITKLLNPKESRKILIRSVLIYCDPIKGSMQKFMGHYEGILAQKPNGQMKRGWKTERIFIPKGWNKTLAQMTNNEWQIFLDEFRKGDHFEQFGLWIRKNNKQK